MKPYYDSLYGKVDLDDLIFDILSKCPELKRLRYIGLMNFKSFGMLPLTTISRLEHTLGLAYLSQVFSNTNPPLNYANDLLVASLFHDVNCGSFGHSIEWAINRYKPYDHEKKAEWVTQKEKRESLSSLDVKPIFLDQPGIHKHNFAKKYNIDFEKVNNIIQGREIFVLNNRGIDLDNIDNVFRMGLYMGILSVEARNFPLLLAKHLKIKDGVVNFVIDEKYIEIVKYWHVLRSQIYRTFIYSRDYMGFEYLLFKLVGEYTKCFDIENISNLFNFTDERLLWDLFNRDDVSAEVKGISKKLLLHNLPYSYSILRTDNFNIKSSLMAPDILDGLTLELNQSMLNPDVHSGSYTNELYLHVTTDDRKTCRMIDINVIRSNKLQKESIGANDRYLLVAVLGKLSISKGEINYINDKLIRILANKNLGSYEVVSFSDDTYASGASLF